jgi:aspartyl aminopeptidase
MKRALPLVLAALCLSPPAGADEDRIGHKPTAWPGANRAAVDKFAADYSAFVGANKTEREVVRAAMTLAKRRGFADLLAARRPAVRPGARLYAEIDGKLAAFITVGKRPLSEGLHVVASHIDAVRIDLKQRPLYADGNLALLQTHYYGGIKKYQWLSVPLELRGVVVTRAGKRIDVSIGAAPGDPVFIIPDVAAHVSWHVDREEGEETPGESLDPIAASTPAKNPGKRDPFAAQAAALLSRRYKIELADLASAELSLVPAMAPRDVGLDRALIGAYGHDDRSCAYASLRALLEVNAPEHTAVVYLADKEEIGSHGNTGARSALMRRIVAELLEGTGVTSTTAAVDRTLAASMVFSADVTGAVNPTYKKIYEKGNAAFLGAGVVWNQSAMHAEVMGYVRRLFDGAGVTHQPADWTKSTGGAAGGTVLEFFTQLGMRGLDVSIPLLSMHSPYEIISKVDLYEAYRGYRAFLAD